MNDTAPNSLRKLCVFTLATSLMVTACSGGGETADDGPSAVELTSEAADIVSSMGADSRPVKIGWNGPNFDACPGYGVVKELGTDGVEFLSVRSSPNEDAEEIDQLTAGTGLTMCDTSNGWFGIVYEGSGAEGTECGVSSPVDELREYDGPCRSWLDQRQIRRLDRGIGKFDRDLHSYW